MARVDFTPFWPCREAQGVGRARSEAWAVAWAESVPLLGRRGRSEQSEFGSAAPRTSIAGCPEGDTASGAAFSLPTFFSRSKCK